MNYTYRVYNALTGHEYADVDNAETAVNLSYALQEFQGVDPRQITIDVLVAETSAPGDA